MRNIFLFLFFVINFAKISAQIDLKISDEICDSLNAIKAENSVQLRVDRFAKKIKLLSLDNLPKETFEKEKNFRNYYNVLQYKIARNLKKNCSIKNLDEDYSFQLKTSVVDFDNVFTFEQFKDIETKIIKIREEKEIEILVLEVDNFYPYDDITDYSFKILENWNNGFDAEKGKMIIVFSKGLRKIRISTDGNSKQYLSDEFLQKNINELALPNFKAGDFYQGIIENLNAIEKKL